MSEYCLVAMQWYLYSLLINSLYQNPLRIIAYLSFVISSHVDIILAGKPLSVFNSRVRCLCRFLSPARPTYAHLAGQAVCLPEAATDILLSVAETTFQVDSLIHLVSLTLWCNTELKDYFRIICSPPITYWASSQISKQK